MLTYADVCGWRMLTHADVCRSMLLHQRGELAKARATAAVALTFTQVNPKPYTLNPKP